MANIKVRERCLGKMDSAAHNPHRAFFKVYKCSKWVLRDGYGGLV